MFDGFATGVTDRWAVAFRRIGLTAFAAVTTAHFLFGRYKGNAALGTVIFACFMLGPIMFACYGIRVMGLKKGIVGGGNQAWAVLHKVILYILLPAGLITAGTFIYAHYFLGTI